MLVARIAEARAAIEGRWMVVLVVVVVVVVVVVEMTGV